VLYQKDRSRTRLSRTPSRLAEASRLLIAVVIAGISGTAAQDNPTRLGLQDGYLDGADGIRLFYRRIGGGDPVLFLHGGPGGSFDNGGYSIEPLGRERSVIMYDQRGAGRSQIVTDTALLTAAHHVRDVEAVRRYFKLERMSVIGLSWGAGLAAMYADAYPERVARVVFLIPMPPANKPFVQERNQRIRSLLDPKEANRLAEVSKQLGSADDDQVAPLCREQLAILSRPEVADPGSYDPTRLDGTPLGKEIAGMCSVPPAAIRNQRLVGQATIASLGDWDFRPMLSRLNVPALVIEGEKTNVPLDATREWAKAIPNARILLVPNAGHLVLEEQPRAIDEIAAFLRDQWPAGSSPVSR